MKTNVINITIFTRHCVRGREEEKKKYSSAEACGYTGSGSTDVAVY